MSAAAAVDSGIFPPLTNVTTFVLDAFTELDLVMCEVTINQSSVMLEIGFFNKMERVILKGIHLDEVFFMKFIRSLRKCKVDTLCMRQCSTLSAHVATCILENILGVKFITGSIEKTENIIFWWSKTGHTFMGQVTFGHD